MNEEFWLTTKARYRLNHGNIHDSSLASLHVGSKNEQGYLGWTRTFSILLQTSNQGEAMSCIYGTWQPLLATQSLLPGTTPSTSSTTTMHEINPAMKCYHHQKIAVAYYNMYKSTTAL